MAESLRTIGFSVLFLAAMIWLALVEILCQRLRIHHPDLYEKMGSPSLFGGASVEVFGATVHKNKGTQGALALLRFIYSAEPRQLGDPGLTRLCQVMRVLLPSYLVGFVAFLCFSIAYAS